MRLTILAAFAATFAAPALAQAPTTLDQVIRRGIVMKAYGMEVPVRYAPDGTFTATTPSGAASGVWRIDGARLCTKMPPAPEETCAAYPAGKGSGDTFEVPGAMGPQMGVVTVRIN